MGDYQAWADDTAARMREVYDREIPKTCMERLFGKRSTSPGIIADNLMLSLLNEALNARREWLLSEEK